MSLSDSESASLDVSPRRPIPGSFAGWVFRIAGILLLIGVGVALLFAVALARESGDGVLTYLTSIGLNMWLLGVAAAQGIVLLALAQIADAIVASARNSAATVERLDQLHLTVEPRRSSASRPIRPLP